MAAAAAAAVAAARGSQRRVAQRARRLQRERGGNRVHSQHRNDIEAALHLQLLAAEPGVRLEQICLLDHSGPGYRPRHLHLQCIFTDGSASAWLSVDGTLPTLREALRAVQSSRVRLHVHDEPEEEEDEEPNGGAASARTVEALPRLTLEERSAERLVEDGIDSCPFCLEAFGVGDEVVCMPCPGMHIAHTACMRQWLKVASTCPSCRFMLPHGAPDRMIHLLVAPARLQLARIRDALAPPCQPCIEDDEPLEDAVAPLAEPIPPPMAPIEEGSPNMHKALLPASSPYDHRTAAEAAASATAAAMAAAANAAAAALERAQSDEAREVAELHQMFRSGSGSPRLLSPSDVPRVWQPLNSGYATQPTDLRPAARGSVRTAESRLRQLLMPWGRRAIQEGA